MSQSRPCSPVHLWNQTAARSVKVPVRRGPWDVWLPCGQKNCFSGRAVAQSRLGSLVAQTSLSEVPLACFSLSLHGGTCFKTKSSGDIRGGPSLEISSLHHPRPHALGIRDRIQNFVHTTQPCAIIEDIPQHLIHTADLLASPLPWTTWPFSCQSFSGSSHTGLCFLSLCSLAGPSAGKRCLRPGLPHGVMEMSLPQPPL